MDRGRRRSRRSPPQKLTAIHDALRKAQVDAAREASGALEEKAKSDVEAQKEIEKLKAGTDKIMATLPEKMPVKDLIEMREKLDIEKRGRQRLAKKRR